MTNHKLSAGDGYVYLTRQVANHDEERTQGQDLGDYYSEKGEQPGRWTGSGLSHLDGVEAGSHVGEDQMRALFGNGRHPDADRIEAVEHQRVYAAAVAEGHSDARAARAAGKAADAASRLGETFRNYSHEPRQFLVECGRAFEAHNVHHGRPRSAKLDDAERATIRTRIGQMLFTEQYARAPADARELQGFIARESRPTASACAGYDLTFSPVKSVSALWAVADRETAKVIEDAHEAAWSDTLRWLEQEVIYTRRGADGVRAVDVNGVVATAFVHRDSRAGDPDLHTHVAIANKVQDPTDGGWRAIDGQVLYKHTVAASERYNSRLEAELTQRLGVAWSTAGDPRADKRVVREIDGVDAELLRRWSTRRADVERRTAELAEGFHAAYGRVATGKEALALAQQANLETREAKRAHRSLAEQREQWRSEAEAVLGDATRLEAMLSSAVGVTTARPDDLTAEAVGELVEEVLDTIENDRATFQTAHVRAEAERVVRARALSPDALVSVVNKVTAASLGNARTLSRGAPRNTNAPVGLRRRDGTSQYDRPGSQLFTTVRVVAAEADLIAASHETGARRVSAFDVDVALLGEVANGVDLTTGQRRLVESMATSGAQLQLALAPAGTGKTTAMRALSTAWRNSGGTVVALAPSAVAAAELGAATGTDAETIAKLVHDLTTGRLTPGPQPEGASPLQGADARTLVLVDEAGMASTPDLARVVAWAKTRGATIRLVGDDRQLAAIGAGGVLRDIANDAGALTLDEVVRFTHPGEATASLALRAGDATQALGFYLDQDRVRASSPLTGGDDVFTSWSRDRQAGHSSLMLASTRDVVDALNERARTHRLTEEPDPGGATVRLRSGLVASAGDTVVTRQNRRDLPITRCDFVKNGDRWRISEVHDDGSLSVCHEKLRRTIELPADYVRDQVDLGYATTVYGAQGQSVDTCHALFTGQEDRNSAYVAMTRGRLANTAYALVGGDGDEHTRIHEDQVMPRTAAEVLHRVFTRDTSAVSAHHADAVANDPTTRLAQAAAVYADAVGTVATLIAGPDHAETLATGAETLVPGITASSSWEQLACHLAVRHLEGADALQLLDEASKKRTSTGVRDLAAVHLYRLAPSREHGPLAWLPALPGVLATDPTYGPWLTERATTVTHAAGEVRARVAATAPADLLAWAQPLRHDPELIADLSEWRAARGVEDTDLRPTGAKPGGRFERLHYTRLEKRLTTSGAALPGTAATWWATHLPEDLDHLVQDPWWPVLADKLDDIAARLEDDHDPTLLDLDLPESVHPADSAAPAVAGAVAPGENRDRGADTSTSHDAADDGGSTEGAEGASIAALHAAAHEFYRAQCAGSWVPAYLTDRGLGALVDDQAGHQAGYAPRGPRALIEHLTRQGHSEADLVEAGLAVQGRSGRAVDRFRNRAVLPIRLTHPVRGVEVVGFVGRAPADADPKRVPKYLNTSTTAAYRKSEVLYGLAENIEALRAGAVPVIVEGPLDAHAVTIASQGRAVGLSPGGTALTAQHLQALGEVIDLTTTTVVVATDQDTAGRAAAVRAWDLLTQAGVSDTRSAALGSLRRKDPGEVLQYVGAEALTHAVTSGATTPLIGEVVTNRLSAWEPVLDHIHGNLGALRSLAPDLARTSLEHSSHATAQLIVALDLDVEVILHELDLARTDQHPTHPATSPTISTGLVDHEGNRVVETLGQVSTGPSAPTSADGVAEVPTPSGAVVDQMSVLIQGAIGSRPLPDEHPAAALYARLLDLTESPDPGPVPRARSSAEQLLSVLEVPDAARVRAGRAWPAVETIVEAAHREGHELLVETLRLLDPRGAVENPEAYGIAVLDHLTPAVARTQTSRPNRAPASDEGKAAPSSRAEDNNRRAEEAKRERYHRGDDYPRPPRI